MGDAGEHYICTVHLRCCLNLHGSQVLGDECQLVGRSVVVLSLSLYAKRRLSGSGLTLILDALVSCECCTMSKFADAVSHLDFMPNGLFSIEAFVTPLGRASGCRRVDAGLRPVASVLGVEEQGAVPHHWTGDDHLPFTVQKQQARTKRDVSREYRSQPHNGLTYLFGMLRPDFLYGIRMSCPLPSVARAQFTIHNRDC
jgi:hypothetical protein